MSVIMVPEGRDPRTIENALLLEPSSNLSPDARHVATVCARMAQQMVNSLRDGEYLWDGLQKLNEAKNCFVHQSLTDGGLYHGPNT